MYQQYLQIWEFCSLDSLDKATRRLAGVAESLKSFVSLQWSIVITDKSNIRNNKFIEKPIPAYPSCRLDSLVALRNLSMHPPPVALIAL